MTQIFLVQRNSNRKNAAGTTIFSEHNQPIGDVGHADCPRQAYGVDHCSKKVTLPVFWYIKAFVNNYVLYKK